MIRLALTGSIGMGKSTVAKMFLAEGVPFFDADAVVRDLQANDRVLIDAIGERFPGTVAAGVLDRDKLAANSLLNGLPVSVETLQWDGGLVASEVKLKSKTSHRVDDPHRHRPAFRRADGGDGAAAAVTQGQHGHRVEAGAGASARPAEVAVRPLPVDPSDFRLR